MTSLTVVPPAIQQRWHALYKASPLVIIMLYMRTVGDRPVTQTEISNNFDISRNTAAKSLRQLSQLGKVTQISHNEGYSLTDSGRQMLLGLDKPGCSNIEHPSLKESLLLKDLKDSKDLKDMKERKKEMLKTLTSDRILSETGKLFPGHEVISFGLSKNLEPDYVLAWLAQAYDQYRSGKIGYPWALVYKRLKANSALPDKKYQADALQFLPNDFLVALDLADPEVIDAQSEEFEPCVEHIKTYTCTVDMEVHDAWTKVLDYLKVQVPRASFETWIKDTYPVEYENQLLSIAVRNQYAADWLESRCKSTIEEFLSGVLANESHIDFVVVMEESLNV